MTNLSGSWLGTYWQEGVPSRFEVTLIQGGNSLSGRIMDDNHLGEASLTGEAIGRRISFCKRYLIHSRHAVDYTGVVSEDENYMQGQWKIDSNNSGTWEAYRSDDNLTLNLNAIKSSQVPANIK